MSYCEASWKQIRGGGLPTGAAINGTVTGAQCPSCFLMVDVMRYDAGWLIELHRVDGQPVEAPERPIPIALLAAHDVLIGALEFYAAIPAVPTGGPHIAREALDVWREEIIRWSEDA